MFTSADFTFMARAIKSAQKGKYTTHPNPRVACVIVKDEQIIGEGWHQRAGQPHAEINALASLVSSSKDSTAYVTLEPCSHTGKTPPCADALIKAGLKRVVIAMQDPNPQVAGQGIQRLRDAGIKVDIGILEQQARDLNLGFIKRMEKGLPWVRLKLAMSLDGRTAMASGESQWITGQAARQDVQYLRARADAILTGIGTVLADDPSLNVRLSADDLGHDGEVLQPARVVVDTNLQTPIDAKLLSLEGRTIIATADSKSPKAKALEKRGVQVLGVNTEHDNRLSLTTLLQNLATQEINEVHVEAGATLCGSLIQQKLVDEMIIYIAPSFLGANARGLLDLAELEFMQDKVELSIQDIRAVGDDWRMTVIPK